MKQFYVLKIVFCFIIYTSINYSQIQYVGIKSNDFNSVYSDQDNSQWCWAASIQMILNYYGIDISQEDIVRRSYGSDPYGNLPNWTGNSQTITANLNNWNISNNGIPYRVSATMGIGAPTPAILLNEMQNGAPVLLGYMSSPNSGHAVVATAVSYSNSYFGPIIQSIIVRDPWPSPQNIMNLGKMEYSGNILASKITAYWYIRVLQ